MRLFIAVLLPATIVDTLRTSLSGWARQWPNLKWVAPENLHITLKFLGDVPPERLENITNASQEVLLGFESFQMVLAGIGSFPNSRNPRVVWMGIDEGGERLAAMAGSLEEKLFEIGFPKEERPWTPHLTIARSRPGQSRRSSENLPNWLDRHAATPFGLFKVERASLMESWLTPRGPVYECRRDFPIPSPSEGEG